MATQENSKQFYVYLHSAPERGVFYVGKGIEARCKRIPRTHNIHHSRIIEKYGIKNISVTLIPCASEQHAFELEIEMIASLKKAGVKLANMTEGGEGASGYIHSEESKAKISIASSSRSELFRNKIYQMAKREAVKNLAAQINNDPSIITAEITKAVYKIIENHSSKGGIATYAIQRHNRAYRKLSKDERDAIIKHLVDSKKVTITLKNQKNKSQSKILMANPQ
jgi:hypothetical protein